MNFNVTALIENQDSCDQILKNEHGLSFYIEWKDKKILFDTGKSEQFLENAKNLKKNLSNIDYVILSHGHYDHTGGFAALLDQLESKPEFLFGNGFFEKKYYFDGTKYIYYGVNFSEKILMQKNLNYRVIGAKQTQIEEGMYIFSNFERKDIMESSSPYFYIRDCKGYIVDEFYDEICLGVDTAKGLVLIVGCAHPGIKNMVSEIVKLTGKKIYAIIGGIHLMDAEENRINKTLKYFKEDLSISKLGLCHCSGQEVLKRLKYSKCFIPIKTGTKIELE